MTTLMTNSSGNLSGKCTFRGGVHPPHLKMTKWAGVSRINLSAGQLVVIPMLQHIGAVCAPVVEPKQEVTAGEVVGKSEAFVSAPVHSPVNGVVKEVSHQPHPGGSKVLSVVITVGEKPSEKQLWREMPGDFDLSKYTHESISKLIRKAGVVGMGGAAFPTAVKLVWNPKRPVDSVIANGCECEPYLTSDDRLMCESARTIVAGLQLAMKAIESPRGIIAIEDNKPAAIKSILSAIEGIGNIQVAICQTKYPQGGERQLIKAVLDRVVPTGRLPRDVDTIVINVGTAAAIMWACYKDRPLTERIVTVTGKGINKPGNYRVPVGMLLSDLIEHCGGLTDNAEKVLLGGPMMGPTAASLNVPILKGTSGITVMSSEEVVKLESSACIRCSRCVDHCPLKLVPTRIAHAVKARNVEMAVEYDLMACMECGCCSYVCPAQIPLVQYLRAGKAMVAAAKK